MGLFHEYIGRGLTPQQVDDERKQQLRRIGDILECDVLTYAIRLTATPVPLPNVVLYDDLLPFVDLLQGLHRERIAVVLETHGGAGEIGRQMVEVLHERFQHVIFIVPGVAKSTGTIMVLGGHEILMGPGSALGPIDAQLQQDGKTYSADALIEGMNRIKKEVDDNEGKLNPAYIPFLQKLSPGEIEHAHNALEFARETVREWLIKYKFGKWVRRETSGEEVTDEYKAARADDIARALASQSRWKTHGRSLRIADLRELGLKIRDFTEDEGLADAVQRYYVLLRMTLDRGDIYKIFETPDAAVSQRFQMPAPPTLPGFPGQPVLPGQNVGSAQIGIRCPRCTAETHVQLDFQPGIPLQPGSIRYPASGHVSCPACGQDIDCTQARQALEKQVGRAALNPQPKG